MEAKRMALFNEEDIKTMSVLGNEKVNSIVQWCEVFNYEYDFYCEPAILRIKMGQFVSIEFMTKSEEIRVFDCEIFNTEINEKLKLNEIRTQELLTASKFINRIDKIK